jgi:hypothetical protein
MTDSQDIVRIVIIQNFNVAIDSAARVFWIAMQREALWELFAF